LLYDHDRGEGKGVRKPKGGTIERRLKKEMRRATLQRVEF